MSYLLDNHKATFDPFRGRGSIDQASLGLAATRGVALPQRNDTILLVRRALYPTPQRWRYCGQAPASSGTVRNRPGFGHATDMGYQYAASRCHANGYRSPFSEPIRLDFDGGGSLITPKLPLWPADVAALPIAGGKYLITWGYNGYGHGDWPADFQVFEGATAATIDYGTPLTDSVTGLTAVAFTFGETQFEFTTGAFGDLTSHAFGVRARNSGAVAEKNTFATAVAKARSVGPADASIRSVRAREYA